MRGDGIVPTELAFMDHPARNVVIDACSDMGKSIRHAHVLPTPWSLIDGYAPSWKLPEEYDSSGVLGQWLNYIVSDVKVELSYYVIMIRGAVDLMLVGHG